MTGASSRLFARLPLPIIQTIVELAVEDSQTRLLPLTLVSSAWRSAILALVSARVLPKFAIEWTDEVHSIGTRQELLDLRYKLTLRRVYLRELYIEEDLNSNEVSMVEWNAVLAAAPGVEKLHICPKVPLTRLADILRAAMRLCPRVRSLTIENLYLVMYADMTAKTKHFEAALVALQDACAQWRANGGLKELKVEIPFGRLPDHGASATHYVQSLATNCPNLEVVSDHDEPNRRMPNFLDEHWHIGLDTWEQFCASCTQLVAFEWTVVPFATAFFEAFARFPKPNLEHLTLACSTIWDWDVYHRQYGRLGSGFGSTARHHDAVLAACPNLCDLIVVCPPPPTLTQVVSTRHGFLADTFCESLATCCRHLERFQVASDYSFPIQTFTDKAMLALATLPILGYVDLQHVSVTGDGVFALVVNSSSRCQRLSRRHYSIGLGHGGHSRSAWSFYDTVMRFLERVARTRGATDLALPCASDPVLLQLRNHCPNTIEASPWHRNYIRKLVDRVKALRAQHPDLRLRVVVENARSRQVGDVNVLTHADSIEELDFYTDSAQLPPDNEGWMGRGDRWIDDVFLDRR